MKVMAESTEKIVQLIPKDGHGEIPVRKGTGGAKTAVDGGAIMAAAIDPLRRRRIVPLPKPCPCGCGTILRAYNGHRLIVCNGIWHDLPRELRAAIMLPGSTVEERRKAARRIFEIAHTIREQRGGDGRH